MKTKTVTHSIAGIIVVLCGILCTPAVHSLVVSFAAHNPYASIVVGALLSLAALYHNPKTPAA